MTEGSKRRRAPPTQPPPIPETAEALKRIVREWPRLITEGDVELRSPDGQRIRACIAPDFTARLDGHSGGEEMGFEDLCAIWKREITEFPDAFLELVDCHAYVDEDAGTAKVYLDMDLSFQKGIDLKAFTELRWTRDKDRKWFIREFHGMRADSSHTGFV